MTSRSRSEGPRGEGHGPLGKREAPRTRLCPEGRGRDWGPAGLPTSGTGRESIPVAARLWQVASLTAALQAHPLTCAGESGACWGLAMHPQVLEETTGASAPGRAARCLRPGHRSALAATGEATQAGGRRAQACSSFLCAARLSRGGGSHRFGYYLHSPGGLGQVGRRGQEPRRAVSAQRARRPLWPKPHSAPTSRPVLPVPTRGAISVSAARPPEHEGLCRCFCVPWAWQPQQTACAICLCKMWGLLLTEIESPSARSLCWSAERPRECVPNDTV